MDISMSTAGLATLPHSRRDEEIVLGASLKIDGTSWRALRGVEPDQFFFPLYRSIYQAVSSLRNVDAPPDLGAVLERTKALETASTDERNKVLDELQRLALEAPEDLASVIHSASILRVHRERRHLISIAHEIEARCVAHEDPRAVAKDAVDSILNRDRRPLPARSIASGMNRAVQTLERQYESKQWTRGVPTGLRLLDSILGGLQAGKLIVVGSRPGMGKTSLLASVLAHATVDCKVPALLFHLEGTIQEYAERIIALRAHLDGNRIRSAALETRDWIQLTKAASDLVETRLMIHDGAVDIDDIVRIARDWRSDAERFPDGDSPGIVAIDYAQLIQGQLPEEQRYRELSAISRALKALAKELNLPVVILSQLNRNLETRDDRRPVLYDLRDSGTLEDDADVVIFIYREEFYAGTHTREENKGAAELDVAKQRGGQRAIVRVAFLETYGKFMNFGS